MNALHGRLSSNTITLLVGNFGSAILSFALSILVGRVLGETGLGVYAATLAWVYPLSLLTEFGLGTLITREVARDQSLMGAYVRVTIMARLLIGGGIMIMLLLGAPFLSDNPQVVTGLRLSAPLVLIVPMMGVFTAVFRAQREMRPVTALNIGMLLAQVSLTVAVFVAGFGIIGAFVVNTATSAMQLLAAFAIYRRGFHQPSKFRLALPEVLRAATPFAIAAVLAAMQSRVILILLERYGTAAAVGYFAAAMRFVEAGRLLPHAFFDALFPLLSALAATPTKLERTFRRIMLGLGIVGVGGALVAQVVSAPLIGLAFGDSFVAAIPILQIAVWGLAFSMLKGGRTLYWYAQGRENVVNRVTAMVIIAQVALASWVIPRFGVIGAAWVYSISEALAFALLMLPLSSKKRG